MPYISENRQKSGTCLFGTSIKGVTNYLRTMAHFKSHSPVLAFKIFFPQIRFWTVLGWCPFIEFWRDLLGKKGHGTVEFHRYIVKSQITMKKISKCNEYENNDLLCLPAVWLRSSVTSGARGVGMSP